MRLHWLVGLVAIVIGSACAPPPPTVVPETPLPVVLVPGWEHLCTPKGLADWRSWIVEAALQGVDLTVMQPDPCQSNIVTSQQIGEVIAGVLDRTGAPSVVVVAHSMGSLAARWCIRFGSCAGHVSTLVGIAPANHGTIWAEACEAVFWSHSTCDMKPGSTMLTQLNTGDETWGDTRYVVFQSACDFTIVPFTSSFIEGAENVLSDRCLGHSDWKSDALTINWVFDQTTTAPPQH